VIPAVCRQEGHPATKTLLQFPLFNMECKTDGQVQPIVPRGQQHLSMTDGTVGNPAKLQDRVPVIMKIIDLMPCSEAGAGLGGYF